MKEWYEIVLKLYKKSGTVDNAYIDGLYQQLINDKTIKKGDLVLLSAATLIAEQAVALRPDSQLHIHNLLLKYMGQPFTAEKKEEQQPVKRHNLVKIATSMIKDYPKSMSELKMTIHSEPDWRKYGDIKIKCSADFKETKWRQNKLSASCVISQADYVAMIQLLTMGYSVTNKHIITGLHSAINSWWESAGCPPSVVAKDLATALFESNALYMQDTHLVSSLAVALNAHPKDIWLKLYNMTPAQLQKFESASGTYHDRYFTVVAGMLKEQGEKELEQLDGNSTIEAVQAAKSPRELLAEALN